MDDVSLPLLPVLAADASRQLTAQAGLYTDPAWLADGTKPVPANYTSWALTPDRRDQRGADTAGSSIVTMKPMVGTFSP